MQLKKGFYNGKCQALSIGGTSNSAYNIGWIRWPVQFPGHSGLNQLTHSGLGRSSYFSQVNTFVWHFCPQKKERKKPRHLSRRCIYLLVIGKECVIC